MHTVRYLLRNTKYKPQHYLDILLDYSWHENIGKRTFKDGIDHHTTCKDDIFRKASKVIQHSVMSAFFWCPVSSVGILFGKSDTPFLSWSEKKSASKELVIKPQQIVHHSSLELLQVKIIYWVKLSDFRASPATGFIFVQYLRDF